MEMGGSEGSGSGLARLDTDFGYSSSAAAVPKPPPLPPSSLADAAAAASERASNAMTATRPVGGAKRAKGLSSNIPAILAGMLLATMLLPWHLISRPPVEGRDEPSIDAPFAWQLLANAQPIEWAYLVGLWLVGGVTMITLALFGGLVRGMVLLFLGLVGMVLAFGLHASHGSSLAWLENSWVFEVSVAWRLFWGVTLLVLGMNLFALHWRAACGRLDVVRWSVAGIAGLGVAWMLVCSILVLNSLPASAERPDWIITPYWGLVLVCLSWLGGCGLLLADSIRGRGHLAAYSALPLYIGLLLAGLLVMITPVLAAQTGGMVLRSLNLVMFGVGGALGLAVYGGTETAIELTPKRGGGAGPASSS